MEAQSDSTRAILKSLSDRPESVPRGYEFLPDAFKRDVEPLGPEARDQVVRALAEGDIPSFLQTHLGHWEPIPLRMWRKYPLARKVHPRFCDGKMRMGRYDHEGPYLVGWICVGEGDLQMVVQRILSRNQVGPQRGPFSFAQLKKSYKEYVTKMVAAGRHSSRQEDREVMSKALGVKIPYTAIQKLRADHAPDSWKLRGRRPQKSAQK